MRDKRLVRVLIVLSGTFMGLATLSARASAEIGPGLSAGGALAGRSAGIGSTGGLGALPSAGPARAAPASLGGVSPENVFAGHASGLGASNLSTGRTFALQGALDPSQSGLTFTNPPSPRRSSPVTSAPAVVNTTPVTPPTTFTPQVVGTPTFVGGFPSLGTVNQGQNNGSSGTATSGPAGVTSNVTLQVGPVGGSQTGNNSLVLNPAPLSAISGPAIVNSQVFGNVNTGTGLTGLASNPFFGLPFGTSFTPSVVTTIPTFTTTSAFFAPSPFWGTSPFFFEPTFSSASLLRAEILNRMAQDCLANFAENPSFTLWRICNHRIAAASGFGFSPFIGTPFFGLSPFWGSPWFGGNTLFFSQGGTNVLSTWGGTAISSGGTSVFIGPLGTSVAGPGGAFTFGLGGFAAAGPFGAASGGGWPRLFAPFGSAWSPFWGGQFGSQFFVPSFAHSTSGLFVDPWSWSSSCWWNDWSCWHFHRHLVLGTEAFSSFGDGFFGFGGCCFSPFGGRTVFVAGDNVFVPSPFFTSWGSTWPWWFSGSQFDTAPFHWGLNVQPSWWGGNSWWNTWNANWWWNTPVIQPVFVPVPVLVPTPVFPSTFWWNPWWSNCTNSFFFVDGCFSTFGSFNSFGNWGPVLDLPGIQIGAGGFI